MRNPFSKSNRLANVRSKVELLSPHPGNQAYAEQMIKDNLEDNPSRGLFNSLADGFKSFLGVKPYGMYHVNGSLWALFRSEGWFGRICNGDAPNRTIYRQGRNNQELGSVEMETWSEGYDNPVATKEFYDNNSIRYRIAKTQDDNAISDNLWEFVVYEKATDNQPSLIDFEGIAIPCWGGHLMILSPFECPDNFFVDESLASCQILAEAGLFNIEQDSLLCN